MNTTPMFYPELHLSASETEPLVPNLPAPSPETVTPCQFILRGNPSPKREPSEADIRTAQEAKRARLQIEAIELSKGIAALKNATGDRATSESDLAKLKEVVEQLKTVYPRLSGQSTEAIVADFLATAEFEQEPQE